MKRLTFCSVDGRKQTHPNAFLDRRFANTVTHTLTVPVICLAGLKGIPIGPSTGGPNPRDPRDPTMNKGVAIDIRNTLLNKGQWNQFYDNNNGIDIVAANLERIGAKQDDYGRDVVEWALDIDELKEHGVLNGGNTFELIMASLSDVISLNEEYAKAFEEVQARDGLDLKADFDKIRQKALDDIGTEYLLPIINHVKVTVHERYPQELLPQKARGLNNAVQVTMMSVINDEHSFDWIKAELPHPENVSFYETDLFVVNGKSKKKPADVLDIISILELFDIQRYQSDGVAQPTRAIQQQRNLLDDYNKNRNAYEKLTPLLQDIMTLSDTVALTATDYLNNSEKPFAVRTRQRGDEEFPHLNVTAKQRLFKALHYPVLASFRALIKVSEN